MSRSFLLLAVSGLALAACQPASEAPQDVSAETPPVVAEVAETVEADAEDVAAAAEDVVEAAAETVEEHDHEDAHDHADEDHEHDGEHAHEDGTHEDEHDHDDHAHEAAHEESDHEHDHDEHDHDNHDHAGGEAHVHGLSELAASLDGTTFSVNIEGALANFDLDETIRTLEDTAPYTDGVVEIVGGDCTSTAASASVRPIGDHGNMVIDLTYDCAAAGSIEAINVTGFQNFAGFEEVNAVFLTGTDQTAETLTKSDTRLDVE